MKPWLDDGDVQLYHGDCVEVMRELPEASVDAVVCDPPYGLEFMGKDWDKLDRRGPASFENLGPDKWETRDPRFVNSSSPYVDKPRWSTMGPIAIRAMQAWHEAWAREAFRVLKPGGALLAFGGTRTAHRLASGIEDAGFEIRDTLCWLYGSGFPKSLDVSKAIDKAAGAEREVTGRKRSGVARVSRGGAEPVGGVAVEAAKQVDVTAPATAAAARWEGWGTALKPAYEPVILARRPLSGTVAANVLQHGTGALNIDATRIETSDADAEAMARCNTPGSGRFGDGPRGQIYGGGNGTSPPNRALDTRAGRWPANVLLDETAAMMLDDESGACGGHDPVKGTEPSAPSDGNTWGEGLRRVPSVFYGDRGGASRFFATFPAETPCALCGMLCVCPAPSAAAPSSLDGRTARSDAAAPLPLEHEARPAPSITPAPTAAERSPSTPATSAATAPPSADTQLSERIAHAARSAGGQCERCATATAHELAELLLNPAPAAPRGAASTSEPSRRILRRFLARIAEHQASTGTTPTTGFLSEWFGYAAAAMRCATPADAGENGTGQTRFRYDSKASRAERNTGLHHLPAIRANPYGEGREGVGKTGHYQSRQNTHPTVKPVSLMRWLCRLSCPPGGLVLDPFVGSGSTAVAARAEGFRCIGIDQDLEYLQIAAGRLSQLSLFGGFAED